MDQYSYLGSGKIYARVAGASAGLIELGNCSQLNFSVTEDVKTLQDYTQPGGGTYAEVRRISAVEASIIVHDLNGANMAKALYGISTDVTGATVTDEVVTGYIGALTPLAHPGPYSAVAVKHSTGTPTYVVNEDYEIRAGGIVVLEGGDITDAQSLKVTYTFVAHATLQALVASGKEYQLFFAGLNEARSGKEFTIDAFKVKLGATKELALIGDNFAALELTGKVLKDTSKTGTGVSQYFKAQIGA